jgi:hypothetical protein
MLLVGSVMVKFPLDVSSVNSISGLLESEVDGERTLDD